MRRLIWIVFSVALVGDALVGAWLFRTLQYGSGSNEDSVKKGALFDIRRALFTEATTDAARIGASPEELARQGFLKDTPETIEAWRRETFPKVAYLRDLEAAALPADPIERGKRIALLYSVNGGGGICGGFEDLLEALQRLPDGFGCCSDHTETFLALGQALGLEVRQVDIRQHTFNEIWVPHLGKWVFLDSQYAIVARDGDGSYLSAFEIREHLRTGRKFDYEFFGTPVHEFAKKSPWDSEYFRDIAPFANFQVVWGSNIYSQDRLERDLWFLPRAGSRLIGHLLGVFPHPVLYEDEAASDAPRLRRKHWLLLALAVGLPLGTASPLALWLARRSDRARPRRRSSAAAPPSS